MWCSEWRVKACSRVGSFLGKASGRRNHVRPSLDSSYRATARAGGNSLRAASWRRAKRERRSVLGSASLCPRQRASRRARLAGGHQVRGHGSAPMPSSDVSWWLWSGRRRSSPFLALLLIQDQQARMQVSIAAEVDEALLGDDLPITAYRDAGVAEFLKTQPPSECRAAGSPAAWRRPLLSPFMARPGPRRPRGPARPPGCRSRRAKKASAGTA